MNCYHIRLLSVLLISFSLLYNSCSLAGLGYAVTPDYELVNPDEYMTIKANSKLTISLMNGTKKVVNFVKISNSAIGEVSIKDTTDEFLIYKTDSKIESINLDDISDIIIKSKKSGRWYVLGIGFALDIAFIIFLSQLDPSGLGTT